MIKLKNPNSDLGFYDQIENKGNTNNNNQMRVCPECNREFSSGKALGGHMRIHVQVKKTERLRSENRASPINHQNNEKPICSLCGKNFPSMKSLFGHMRCHPEREWRGIQPPAPAAEKIPSPSVSSEDQVDLMQSLSFWSVTGRRGRKATAPSNSDDDEDEDEEFHNAAGELLLLAHMDSIGSNMTEKQIDEEPEAIYSNGNSKNAQIEEPNSVNRSKKRSIEGFEEDRERRDCYSPVKMMWVNETGSRVFTDCDSKSCSEEELSYRYKECLKIKKRRKKKMKLTVDLASFSPINQNPFDSPVDKYKCSTCNKCFPTFQALGGHRSSHNKFKITTINAIDESSCAAAPIQGDYQHNGNNDNNNNPNFTNITHHQCKICNKSFNTGQALGGHKRCHWTGPVEPPSSQEASQPGQRALEFDLNEVPAMEDDDHAAGCAYDYDALSSYNSNIA